MTVTRSALLFTLIASSLCAQAPLATPTTAVLMSLTVKADADRGQIMKVMPDEVRETVKLYLDGKIQQWYSRADGLGVIFILNCNTIPEAKAIMAGLPLAKGNLVDLQFTAIGPLRPLRLLLGPSAEAAPKR